MIVIRGHKHLHECAYIGDNSSEELEELMEAIREGSYVNPDSVTNVTSTEDEAPANEPELMKRHRPDVEFHSPLHKNNSKNHTMDSNVDTSEITDPKVMKILLEALQVKTKQNKGKLLGRDARSHGHRNSTIAKEETKNFKINPPKPRTTSEEVFSEILSKLRRLGDKGNVILEKVNQEFNQTKNSQTNQTIIDTKGRHYSKPPVNYNDNVDHERRKRHLYVSPAQEMAEDDEQNDMAIEEVGIIVFYKFSKSIQNCLYTTVQRYSVKSTHFFDVVNMPVFFIVSRKSYRHASYESYQSPPMYTKFYW